MLSLPLSWRKRIAHKGRNVSAQNKQQLNMDIMDVTPTAVVELFQKYQVKRMIHGHTHRPDIHIHPVKINEPTSDKKTDATRIVLGDWYTQGSVLKVDAHKFDLQQRTFKKT
jgi:UDP-2,3-diacylglucosamine hydrolase